MSAIFSIFLIVWFVVPWLIVATKIIRVSVYESKLGLRSGLSPFQFTELFRRAAERQKIDSAYDKMRKEVKRWGIITIVWWLASFFGLIAFAFIFAAFSSK